MPCLVCVYMRVARILKITAPNFLRFYPQLNCTAALVFGGCAFPPVSLGPAGDCRLGLEKASKLVGIVWWEDAVVNYIRANNHGFAQAGVSSRGRW